MYPFSRIALPIAIAAATIGGFVFQSWEAGFAWFIVVVVLGMLWRKDEPAILPFCLGFQWIFVVAGYFYTQLGGELKEDSLLGDVPQAITLSMVGLLCLALGLRLGLAIFGRRLEALGEVTIDPGLDLSAMFRATVAVYSISWLVEISPAGILFNAAQIISSILAFREVLLALLLLAILRQGEGWRYGVAVFVVALIPRFISKQSNFKELIFLVAVVLLSDWKPWSVETRQRRRNWWIALSMSITAFSLLIIGVLWEGGVKPIWRSLEIEGTPLEKLKAFASVTDFALNQMEDEDARGVQALISRLSSINQFSLVLQRVPLVVPHEYGRLTKRALLHILVPRLLYPEKENLGDDSWLADEYAGLTIGEDTSVGIGYMAEFYVDWGILGLIPSLIALGAALGWSYGVLLLYSPSYRIGCAIVIVPFLNNFTTYEATLPKLLGGFIMNSLVLLALGQFLARFLARPSELAAATSLRAGPLLSRELP